MDRKVLASKPMTELRQIAEHLGMSGFQKLRKAELVDAIVEEGNGEPSKTEEPSSPDENRLFDDEGALPTDKNAEDETSGTEDRSDGDDTDHGDDDESDSNDAADGDAEDEANGSEDEPSKESESGHHDGHHSGSNRRRRRRTRDRGDGPADNKDGQNKDSNGGRRGGKNQNRKGQDNQRDNGNEVGEVRAGVLDILPEGYGFLRTTGYLPGDRDVYVSQGQIRKHQLRRGDVVQGPIRPQRSNEKVPALHHVERVNSEELDDNNQVTERPDFLSLPVAPPMDRLALDTDDATPLVKLVDAVAPIGRGQRLLMAVPASVDGTSALKELASAVADAADNAHIMYVLIDARPEDVYAIRDDFDGEVIATTFDQPAEEHSQAAELVVHRSRRLVELGHDVVVIIDSITRLARASASVPSAGSRMIAAGIDAASLYPAKRLFASARTIEEGGSLTVLAALDVKNGSEHDDVITREMTRVANAIVTLDAGAADRRIVPPVDVAATWTRHESELLEGDETDAVRSLRQTITGLDPAVVADAVAEVTASDSTRRDLVIAATQKIESRRDKDVS